MRAIALICLLFVAGTCALPASEVDVMSEVAPSKDRMVDVWIILAVEKLRLFFVTTGADPVNIVRREFKHVLIQDLVQLSGIIDRLWFTGLSGLRINFIYYNILIGRLNCDIEIPNLFLSIDKFSANAIYGDLTASIDVQGTVIVRGIRLSGTAVIEAWPGNVNLRSVDPVLSVDDIQSRLTVVGSRGDYSEAVNGFLNIRVPAFLTSFTGEISTVIGELIRIFINLRWP